MCGAKILVHERMDKVAFAADVAIPDVLIWRLDRDYKNILRLVLEQARSGKHFAGFPTIGWEEEDDDEWDDEEGDEDLDPADCWWWPN